MNQVYWKKQKKITSLPQFVVAEDLLIASTKNCYKHIDEIIIINETESQMNTGIYIVS